MKHLRLTFLLALAACGAANPSASYQTLDGQAEPLRTAFNAAHGKVRAIFLASPA
ncbi:MAG: hypothetical protein ABI609_01380 [Acidobacteriota bacterium]